MPKPKGLSTREAAQRLGIGLHRVYELLWAGQLEAERADGKWLIDPNGVERRLKERKRRRG